MYKVSELLGKPLLSLSEARMLGTINNVYFDEKFCKATYVSIFTDEEDGLFFPIAKLLDVTGDAVVTLNSEGLVREICDLPCPINRYAFDQIGNSLGIIKDVIIQNAKVVSLEADVSLLPIRILSANELIVFNTSNKQIKLRSKKDTSEPTEQPKNKIELPINTAICPSYDFLLGKKLQRTISTPSGRIIATQGQNVTSDVINEAKREGKLVMLALNAL
ncbi:MAG: hypothetical protein IKC35_03410 [Clostridia bacterium]|nr:hypothetical protein [Clostridia bacterium]